MEPTKYEKSITILLAGLLLRSGSDTLTLDFEDLHAAGVYETFKFHRDELTRTITIRGVRKVQDGPGPAQATLPLH